MVRRQQTNVAAPDAKWGSVRFAIGPERKGPELFLIGIQNLVRNLNVFGLSSTRKENQMKLPGMTVRLEAMLILLGLLLLSSSLLTGCSKSLPDDGASATVKRFDNLRGVRYCEVFLIGGNPITKDLQAAFYNTTDLNNSANPLDTCPATIWDKLDAEALKKQYDVLGVFKNGPRGWAMDWIELPTGTVKTFDDLQARWMGQVQLPKDVDLHKKGSSAYKPTVVARKSEMTFQKGKPVFIIDDADGMPWVMQAFSQIVDPNLTYEDLQTLDKKLNLPAGWKYRTKVLDQDLTIKAVNGHARIVQDDLENTYDACFDTACSYKP
jgi:hypothetical protein